MQLNLQIATKLIAACAGLVLSAAAFSQNSETVEPPLKVQQAWIRATVVGQKGTGAFMRLTSKAGTRLVGVATPVAGVAEVHEMKMDGDVMRMRAVPELALPAGREVQFKPGGYHLMLLELKQPLMAGSEVPVTLRLKDGKGIESNQTVMLPVMLAAPAPTGSTGTAVKPGKAATPNASNDEHGGHKH
jgi:periplasmic copper chaperone A